MKEYKVVIDIPAYLQRTYKVYASSQKEANKNIKNLIESNEIEEQTYCDEYRWEEFEDSVVLGKPDK